MRILAIITSILLATIAIIALPQLPATQDQQDTINTTVLDIWHIETSEGGSGSRRAWLSSTLQYIEKQHTGLYINIYTYTIDQMITQLEAGDSCDLVSFGMGAGQYLLPYLYAYTGSLGTLSSLTEAGAVDNMQYAVPYMAGIYALFGRSSDLDSLGVSDIVSGALDCSYTKYVGSNSTYMYSVQCGFTTANNPLMALVSAGVSGVIQGVDYSMTQYMAYDNFVSNRYATLLLGTQRDVYRVANRVAQGRLDDIVFQSLNYTDLVQYIGIMSASNTELCCEIIQYLTSDTVQNSLCNIGMLSTTNAQPYTSNGWLLQCQQALYTASTVSVFCDDVTLGKARSNCLEILGA